MNLQVVKWLLAHREVLLKVAEVLRGFDINGSYLHKWDTIDKVARLVIPIIDDNVQAASAEPDGDVQVFAAHVQDLGIDWTYFVQTILPIIISILQALTKS